jgi:hypothetical protein
VENPIEYHCPCKRTLRLSKFSLMSMVWDTLVSTTYNFIPLIGLGWDSSDAFNA